MLSELSELGYVARLDRRPGQKEDRFRQLLGDDGGVGDASGAAEPAPGAGPIAVGGFDEPMAREAPAERSAAAGAPESAPGAPAGAGEGALEARVAALEAEMAALRAQLADLLD